MTTSADYRLGEYTFGRGWYAVAASEEVGRKPLSVHYFGQDAILYRGESGKVVMLDAYCPHMGTHFGKCENSATVLSDTFLEGDSIRCPFHAWRFGPDGVCNDIPYHDGPIPKAARVKSWHVEERWDIVFYWHDPENQAPDIDLPALPEWDDPQTIRWSGLDHVADLNHPIEVFDNVSDAPHLNYLHGSHVVAYENEIDGNYYHQRNTMAEGYLADAPGASILRTEGGRTTTTLSAYHGPGVMIGRFVEANAIQLLFSTPLDDGTSRIFSTALMRCPTANIDETWKERRRQFAALVVEGLRRDGEVWKHKKPAVRIMQLPSDGPFLQARAWYSQFFNPRAKAADILKPVTGIHIVKNIEPWSDSEFAQKSERELARMVSGG